MKRFYMIPLLVFGLAVLGGLAFSHRAMALSGSDFNASRIMDDAIFFNPNTMKPGDIQAFLNSKVPVCDTNGTQPYAGTTRAAYSASRGYPAPFICLKDYSQSIPAMSSDAYCKGGIAGGTETASQIIYDVSQACGVSPKILITLLQKEQNLVTDDWPWSIQYRSATGYGCPDTAACDANYYGFFNQVYNAARQFQRYVKQSSQYNYVGGRTSFVQYNPNAGCGGTDIAIQNQATAGLYNYTPYQPNQAALNNLGGTGDSCSAYGNRNFWYFYINWFGSTFTTTQYAWMYEGQTAFSDPTRAQPFTSYPTVVPGGKIYLQVKARNMGTQAWDQSFLRLGTSWPNDRSSQFADTSWINSVRPTSLAESTIPPGQIGTFNYTLQAPNTTGIYNEHFNLVAEGLTWLNDLNFYTTIHVNTVASPSNSANTMLSSGATLNAGDNLLSPDSQTTLVNQKDGNLVLYSNFAAVWNTGRAGGSSNRLVMQGDGNLVLYDQNTKALWNTETNGHPGAYLVLQTDGNMVVYSSSNNALWATGTLHNPDHLSYINETIWPVGNMYPGQSIDTVDRHFHLVLQRDGNLVLYSPNRAIWATGTDGKAVSYLAMQGDGNLVLYDQAGKPLWYSKTAGFTNLRLVIQQDGNLVLYNDINKPLWNTQTAGMQ